MKKKRGSSPSGAKMVLPGWMASYADMFTILMVFFVLLFSMSQIDQDLFDRVMAGLQTRPVTDVNPMPADGGNILANAGQGILPNVIPPPPAGAAGEEGGIGDTPPTDRGGFEPVGDTVGDLMNTFRMYMADDDPTQPGDPAENIGEGIGDIVVTAGEGYIRINIDDAGGVLFGSGVANLTPAAMSTLHYLGPLLHTFTENGNGIIVEGHTDNRPINTLHFPSNWELSGARAASVVRFFVDNYDIDVHMIAGLGRGEFFPANPANNSEAWAQNRRVEIKIFSLESMERGPVGGWFSIPGTV
ncbi:MAG: OmpA family protein [Defluviitaleaceae bacterium]|nr:OmpA family protein [Defluviitaleaceae bacterium]